MNYLDLRLWLMVAVIGLGTFAGYQHLTIRTLKSDAATATLKLDTALASNVASTATIKSLEVERDAFVLRRAMELKQAQAIVAQSQAEAAEAVQYALAAQARIKALSRQADCRTVMAAPICPSIADELRAAP